ncbi:uncharacterized protein (TIGR04255 family) [Rathayibacter sp. PhB152]|uniref:TIGR04255 family protein n=1 Tax=Rathayibacter sp. PhB152 TaxID=2485190 RepID=UPI000F4CC0E5|nr:TIGR04255 family protein [Rathayibacter sp. PhB152]ROQ64821.1 uncharacterized protein (TIGR04255 family) [Rathayibacter sp. PhB152]
MTLRPGYTNAPLELVVFELAHPPSPLRQDEVYAVKSVLGDLAPIARLEVEGGPLLMSRGRHLNISFGPEALTISTTSYEGWPGFRTTIEAAIRARHGISPIDASERVGLRYINEIRVPQPPAGDGDVDWSEWLVPSVTAPAFDLDGDSLHLQVHRGLAAFSLDEEGDVVAVRYSAAREEAIESTPTLVRRSPSPGGPFFLLDTDASWTRADSARLETFDVESTLATCDRLHAPIGTIFEKLITDRLRKEVLL